MSLKLTIVLAVLTALVPQAAAQKNELAGLVGRTFVSDQGITGATFFNNNIHFGNGLSFEVDYARHVLGADYGFSGVSFEIPFVMNPDEDLNTGANLIPGSYSSFFVAPSARVNVFANSAVSPWVSFGGGLGYFHESSTLLYGGKNPGPTGATDGVLQMGVGLDAHIKGRLGARLAVRDFWSGAPQLNVNTGLNRQHNFFVAGGVVWHY
jgi:hypothetical protein